MRNLVWGLLALVVGLELVSLLLLWWRSPNQLFSPRTLEHISEGMPEAKVIDVLGAAPGIYNTPPYRELWARRHRGRDQARTLATKLGWTYREWLDDRGGVVILFDEKAKVVWKYYLSAAAK